ncbi:MAG: hypothetical protein JWM11_7181 [Planctomycetaceae bacterium]|nr:hypothetical protein [Planctomycetaceae bacterium]
MSRDSNHLNRRELMQTSLLAALGAGLNIDSAVDAASQTLEITTFQVDATPPIGHPCCGGWITPIQVVDDRQLGLGLILRGAGAPVVILAVDWTGILNESHLQLRTAIAEAVGTKPDRVAIQCVHPHNAPFADQQAEKLLASAPGEPPHTLNIEFFNKFTLSAAAAAKASLDHFQPLTHVGIGQAKVDQVAANRRIKGPDGKLRAMRGSACNDEKLRAEPEGLIDPFLKTVSFWNGDKAVAALHYYACHPMSYYGDGRATPDFCGLAREKRRADDPQVMQIYFDGCGGNIAAGKYNDGSKEQRPILRDKIYTAMVAAWKATEKHPLTQYVWRTEPVTLPPRSEPAYSMETQRKALMDANVAKPYRGRASMIIAWLERQSRPIDITCLDLGPAKIVHLPGEPFIEYQLQAQRAKPQGFVCVAGYGDGGTWYIPTAAAYPEGGYEVSVAFVGPASEAIINQAVEKVLG